ncbi:MAG: putative LPS assembly protein LptD [Bacteroidia bacterium]|nr:putative LPS assembly protein LptD [Bacteroidia bacterium]
MAWMQLLFRPRSDTLPASLRDSLIRHSVLSDTLFYEADSIVFWAEKGQAFLYRKVAVRRRDQKLLTGYARVDLERGMLYGYGIYEGDSLRELPIFYSGGERYDMDSLRYDLKNSRGQIFGMRQQLTEEVLAGRTIQLNPDGTFYGAGGYYTTCTQRPPHFYIASTKMKVTPNDQIISGPLYMVVGDVPLPIVAPFGYFPLLDKRTSGVILPLVGQAADRGFFLRGLGYYWAINRYMDARLETDLFTRGGFRSELLWTYRRRYWYDGNLSLQYAYQAFNEPGDPDYRGFRMIFARWQHRQTFSPTASLTASVQSGSSSFLARQSYTAGDFLATNLQSTISYQKAFPHSPWQLTIGAGHTQNLIQRLWTLQLPILALYQNRVFPFQRKNRIGLPRWYERIGYTYRLDAQGLVQVPESLLFSPLTRDTFLWGARHNLQIAAGYTLLRYFQLTPTFNYNEYLYSEYTYYELDTLRRVVQRRVRMARTARDFSGGVSLTTRLYGVFHLGGKKKLSLRHTIIPTIGWMGKPDFSEPRWRFYQSLRIDTIERRFNPFIRGFYGSPTAGRQNMLQFNLNNLLEARYKAAGDTGRKFRYLTLLDNVGASANYNFAADSFHLSPIFLTARTNLLGTRLNLNYTAILDPYLRDTSGRRLRFYRWDRERKVGYVTQMQIGLVASLSPFQPTAPAGEKEENFVFFTLPWRLDISYNLVGTRLFLRDTTKYGWVQTLGFSGEINLTQAWRIQVSSGFDFMRKQVSFTAINIYRDLHCWELSLNWIPFGPRQSYFMTLSARSPKLQDLRVTKRRDWQDRFIRGL